MVSATIGREEPEGTQLQQCVSCGQTLAPAETPSFCPHCKGEEFGWWDKKDLRFLAPDLRPAATTARTAGVWLTGDFEGDYEGTLTAASSLGERCYQARFHRGRLTRISRVETPPGSLGRGEPDPLQQGLVPNVDLVYGKAGDESVVAGVPLEDFRLHRWEDQGLREIASGWSATGKKALGRARGLAYGFLAQPPVDEPKTPPPPPPQDTTRQPPGAPAAPPSIAPAQPGSSEEAPPPAAPVPGRPITSCVSCSPWLIAGLFVAVSLMCSLLAGLCGVVVVMALMCLLDSLRQRLLPRLELTHPLWRAVPIAISLAGLAIGFLAAAQVPDCRGAWHWTLVLTLTALVLGLLFRQCWLKLFLLGCWVLALGGACTSAGDCGPRPPEPATPPKLIEPAGLRPPPLLPLAKLAWQQFSLSVHDAFFFDQAATAVTQGSGTGGDGSRISIEAAARNPALLSDCKRSIYFPTATSFGFNSAEMNPAFEGQLRKLQRVLDAYPDSRRVVITGHSDRKGNDTDEGVFRNVELSEQRAQAVAAWIAAHLGVRPDRMEVTGAGSRFPLFDVPGPLAENRRVEIGMSCPTP